MEPRELDIEAPWGKIAVKLWGNQNDQPVLTIHGLMDNAGSFDGLIPLLPKHFYICIDLPGHGKSSHFPPYLPIHSEDYIMTYTIVMEHFKKEKFIIMGHSYGAQLGVLYSQIYPEKVEKLIILDSVYFMIRQVKYFKEDLEQKYDTILKLNTKQKNSKPPAYTYEEAVERIMKQRPFPLTPQGARILVERMLVPIGDNKYNFSIDQRLKVVMNPVRDAKLAIKTLTNFPIMCPVLIIFAKDNYIQRYLMQPIIIFYKKQKNFTIKFISGHHDVHLNTPELVAPLVTKFMNEQKSKL
ncbi:serine hydrolase-like protein [Euwallacea fornicatus]|uniref:serine hydrolase-like protein n=1 Tax=Euwallacea fornicatus TaxID=995702 RepID=UPI00338E5FDE